MNKNIHCSAVRRIFELICPTLVIIAFVAVVAAQESTGLTPIVRYDATSQSIDSAMSFRFVIKNWIVDGGQEIEDFPERGFLVVQLRGGELTTIINGERQHRQEDEFWTVPEGAVMGLETEDDSAIIQTVSILRN